MYSLDIQQYLYSWLLCMCVWLFNRGCGALPAGRQLYCSCRRGNTVSSLSTQDVGMDLLKKIKNGTTSITRTHYPHHPTRTMQYLLTSPSFPRSLGARFPQYCPVLKSRAIVRWPTCPLIVPRRTHTPKPSTLLVNSLFHTA